MASASTTSLTPRTILWLGVAGVLILALGARTGVAAISPIASHIELDTPLTGLWLGLLGMVPPVAYASAGVITARLARALSLEGVAVLVSVVTGLAHVFRGLAPGYLTLFVSTVVLMLGVGSLNVILPGLVKLYTPERIGLMTSLYSTAMAISTAIPAGAGLVLAEQFGWRWSLAAWSVISLAALVPWIILLPRAWSRRAAEARVVQDMSSSGGLGVLWRSPTARSIALIFSVSGVSAYSVFALLPAILVERAGSSPAEAALGLTLFSLMGVPMSLTIPVLAVRPGWSARLVVVAVLAGLGGFSGLIFLPEFSPLLWSLLAALGTLSFSMALALIGARTATHQMATQLSGFVNTFGYSVAALGPVLTGLLHEITGDWQASLWMLALLSISALPAAWVLGREQTVEVELAGAARSDATTLETAQGEER